MTWVRTIALVFFVGLSGCRPAITVADIDDVIELCKTDVDAVRQAFGRPDEIGMIGELVINEYRGLGGKKTIIAYVDDIVVDVAVNPTGLVELQNRCSARRRRSKK